MKIGSTFNHELYGPLKITGKRYSRLGNKTLWIGVDEQGEDHELDGSEKPAKPEKKAPEFLKEAASLLGMTQGPQGEKGQDADEEAIIQAVFEKVIPLIPTPENGKDGEDADNELIIRELLPLVMEKMPKPERINEASIVSKVIARIRIPQDGKDGEKGKDGSPDTPSQVKDKLESLKGDERLDASAIKNLPKQVANFGGGDSYTGLAKVDSTDTPGTLESKIVAGNNVTITKTNGTLRIASTGGGGGSSAAEDITVDNAPFDVLTATDAQTAFEQADQALLRARSTGLLNGGAVTGVGTTTITYTAGAGDILDNTTPVTPTFTSVSWSGGTLTGYSTNGLYYVYVNSSGTVQTTTTAPGHEDYRLYIWLARVSVTGNVITAINYIPMPLQQYGPGTWDVFRALGITKRDLLVSANGANLNLNVGSGEIYQAGVNFHTDPLNPHEKSFSSSSAFTFRMATQSGTIASDVTSLPVGNYDNAGTVTSIGGGAGASTIFTVLRFPQGNIRILYGQTVYSTFAAAQAAVGTYTPTLPSGYSEAIVIGYIAANKSATALNNTSQAYFVQTNRFGGVGGAVGGVLGNYLLASNNLSDLTSASTARTNLELVAGGAGDIWVEKAGDTMTGDLSVPDEAYDATAWNGSLEVPTKNAIRDKIETISGSALTAVIPFVIDGGGSTITTGIKGDVEVPFACTINRVTMLADQSGSIVVDIWKDTYANYPATDADSITASAVPTITTATKSQDSTLTGWTTTISAGDILRFNVDSVTSIQRLTLSLKVTKT